MNVNARRPAPDYLTIAQSLLSHGADPGTPVDGDGGTLLHLAAAAADSDGCRSMAEMLIQFGANVNGVDERGRTPLWNACYSGHADYAEALLQNGADVDRTYPPPLYRTVLQVAAGRGDLRMVRRLLRYGARANLIDFVRTSPERGTCRNIAVVKTLLRRQEPDATTDAKAIFYAVRVGDVDVVELFWKHRAPLEDFRGRDSTLLTVACQYDQLDVVAVLLDNGVDVNGATARGSTPLFVAAYYGHLRIVRFLLSHAADANRGFGFNLPIRGAVLRRHRDIVRLLVDAGADFSVRAGRSSVDFWAVDGGDYDIIRLLLAAGVDVSEERWWLRDVRLPAGMRTDDPPAAQLQAFVKKNRSLLRLSRSKL